MNKKLRLILSLASCLALIALSSLTVFAEAPDSIDYLYRFEGSEETKTLTKEEYQNFPEITGGTLASGTYFVNRDVTLNNRLVISGEVKLILKDGMTLSSPYGITVAGSSKLYVYGQEQETGKLIANTWGSASSAAIGGGFSQANGDLHFCSGTVIAKLDSESSTGAAIGGGSGGNAGNITIHGGNVIADASAGMYGAGIGAGDEGYGGTVTIWEGNVNATGGEFGAGIGSGDQPGSAPVMTVDIKGGNVTATGGDEAAGIGGGNEGNGATVNISGGEVIASGGKVDYGEGAGIGGGDEGNGGIVNISGGYVNATGGYRAAGIGGGCDGSNSRVTITSGEVHAFGGGPANSGTRQSGGAGIGGGAFGYGGVIIISGGDVEAKGVWGGAGLGGGFGGSVTTVAISGDETKVSANADNGAAAIGGGCSDGNDKGNAYNISISGGEVDARIITPGSGVAGAAIGSGDSGYAANIAITGGTVKAMSEYGNNGAAAIGGGNKGYFGNIRIEGGNVTAVQAYGGAGIGSGSDSEKGSDQAVGKITISGGTIRSAAVTGYGYHSTGAGIGSGSSAESPVHIEISGGNINAYCAMDDGSSTKMDYSGAGIGSGYGSPMGNIAITGGTIRATRGNRCKKADPIGYYDDEQNSVYQLITLDYDKAQIRNEKGEGTDKRVKTTQYDENTNLSRRLALLENDSDWVEIKPCDHADSAYEIVSAGEDGKHKIICDYCLDSMGTEHTHEFDAENKCVCGYYRYTLTFTDGQQGGQSKEAYIYPGLSIYEDDGVNPNVLVRLPNYAPKFVVAGKQFTGWKTDSDPTGRLYDGTESYEMKGDTTFVAQWSAISGVTIVLSSIDGPLAQMQVGDQSSDTKLDDLLSDSDVAAALNSLAAQQDGYVLGTERGSKPMTDATTMNEFNDLSGSDKTVGDLTSGVLYLPMLKEIGEVEVEVKAPVCGTTIVTTGISPPYDQAPRPEVTAKGDSYLIDEGKRWQRYSNGSYAPASYPSGNIDIKGGTTHYMSLAVDTVYGYRYKQGTEETTVKLNDEATVVSGTKTVEPYRVLFNAQIQGVHDFDEWEEATPATCTDKGTEERKCKVDGCDGSETRKTEVDPDAHDYGTPSYKWADDNSSVTAEAVCSHNGDHKIKETVSTKASVVKEATCTEKGRTKYTATFENDVFSVQSRTVEDIDITQHTWGEWEIDKKPTCTEKGTEKRTCSVCGKEEEREVDATGHKWGSWEVTKEPTEEAEGEETRTCSVCGEKETRSIEKLSPAPKPSKKSKDILIAKAIAKGKSSLYIKWIKVKNASGYDIFFAKCNIQGEKHKCRKIKTIKGNKKLSWTRKKLKNGTPFKIQVKAYAMRNGKKVYISRSPMVHAFVGGHSGKYTNAKAVKVSKKAVTLKKGKTFKIKGTTVKLWKNLMLPTCHTTDVRYLTSNSKVAKVSKSGKIRATGKGKCKIYAYAQNGAWKIVKVTVK